MAATRLTGLEFHWFGRGQLLAARYEQNVAMELEPSVTALIHDITKDAVASPDGPSSLRRVADRFILDANAIRGHEGEPSPSLPHLRTDRQSEALRCLAANFEAVASEVAMGNALSATAPPIVPAAENSNIPV